MGPDYVKPRIESPAEWRLKGSEAVAFANTGWWEQFEDPELNALIRTALQNNLDIRVAVATVEEFAARVGITRSALYPQLDAGAGYSWNRNSQTTEPPIPGEFRNTNLAEGLFGLSWEIDLWGRIRRAVEAASAQLAAAEETRRGVVLTLVSSVTKTYIQLRSFDAQLEVAKSTVSIREDAFGIQGQKFRGGEIAEHDYRRAEAELAVAKQTVAALETRVARTENALAILLGNSPRSIVRGKSLDALTLLAVIPAGLPSDLLERRPDILAAEQQLIAANAEIGVAKAEFFPRISLTGLLGIQSAEFDDLWDAHSRVWRFGPTLAQPLFTAGRLDAQVEAAESVKDQAQYNYQRTVINAFREFEDALIGYRKSGEEVQALQTQVSALSRYFDLSQQRHNEGFADYLEVLDAQRNLFSAQLGYREARAQQFQELIDLYSAMGGGWVIEADQAVLQTQ